MVRKLIVFSLLSIALVLIVLVLSLNALIDKNRGRIQAEMEKYLGRSLTFESLRLDLWAGLGLAAEELKIADDSRFAATPFIHAKELRMRVSWLSLLLGKIVIKKFTLQSPEIQIIRNEAGEFNVVALADAGRDLPRREGRGASDGKKRKPATLLIGAIQVSDGRLIIIDRSVKEPIEVGVRDLYLDIRGFARNQKTRLSLSASLFEGEGQNVSVNGYLGPFDTPNDLLEVPLNLQVRIDRLFFGRLSQVVPFLREYALSFVNVTGPITAQAKILGTAARPLIKEVSLAAPFFGAGRDNLKVAGEFDFTQATAWNEAGIKASVSLDSVSIQNLRGLPGVDGLLPKDLDADGPVSLTASLQGNVNNLNLGLQVQADRSELRWDPWLKKGRGITASLNLGVLLQGNQTVLRESVLSLHNGKLLFSGLVEGSPKRELTLHLRTDGIELPGWEKLLPRMVAFEMAGKVQFDLWIKRPLDVPEARSELQGDMTIQQASVKHKKSNRSIEGLNSRVAFRGQQIRLEAATFQLGSSKVSLEGTLPNFNEPFFTYALRSPQLNVADLTQNPNHKTDWLKELASSGELQQNHGGPSVRGNLSSPEGLWQGTPFQKLTGDFSWNPNRLVLHDINLQALEGNLGANGTFSTNEERGLQFQVQPVLETVDLKKLLSQRVVKLQNYVEGALNLKGKLWSEKATWETLQKSLRGEFQAQVFRGALKNLNLIQGVLSKVSGLPEIGQLAFGSLNERYARILKGNDTPFERLQASVKLTNGRMESKDFVLITPDYRIYGEGWVNSDKTLSWKSLLVLSEHFADQLIQGKENTRRLLDRSGRLTIPFVLEGTFPQVQPKPDLKHLADSFRRDLAQQGSDRSSQSKKAMESGQSDWIRKGLEHLFGN